MSGLVHRHAGYTPGAPSHDEPRYDRAVYLVSPQARSVVQRAA
jgi:hypothetical protein